MILATKPPDAIRVHAFTDESRNHTISLHMTLCECGLYGTREDLQARQHFFQGLLCSLALLSLQFTSFWSVAVVVWSGVVRMHSTWFSIILV
jgi:hypothetical protein